VTSGVETIVGIGALLNAFDQIVRRLIDQFCLQKDVGIPFTRIFCSTGIYVCGLDVGIDECKVTHTIDALQSTDELNRDFGSGDGECEASSTTGTTNTSSPTDSGTTNTSSTTDSGTTNTPGTLNISSAVAVKTATLFSLLAGLVAVQVL